MQPFIRDFVPVGGYHPRKTAVAELWFSRRGRRTFDSKVDRSRSTRKSPRAPLGRGLSVTGVHWTTAISLFLTFIARTWMSGHGREREVASTPVSCPSRWEPWPARAGFGEVRELTLPAKCESSPLGQARYHIADSSRHIPPPSSGLRDASRRDRPAATRRHRLARKHFGLCMVIRFARWHSSARCAGVRLAWSFMVQFC